MKSSFWWKLALLYAAVLVAGVLLVHSLSGPPDDARAALARAAIQGAVALLLVGTALLRGDLPRQVAIVAWLLAGSYLAHAWKAVAPGVPALDAIAIVLLGAALVVLLAYTTRQGTSGTSGSAPLR